MFFLKKYGCLVLGTSLITGCGQSLGWTEDVKLPNGREITLKRKVEFGGGSSHLGDPSVESYQYFTFKHPDRDETIEWINSTDKGILRTLALVFDGGVPFLLTQPAYGGDSRKFNCPNPPYILFKYKNKNWENIPLMEIPVKEIRVNLSFVPMQDRGRIEKSNFHLTSEATSNSVTHARGVVPVPYLINFSHMTEQTFDPENCDKPPSYLTPAG